MIQIRYDSRPDKVDVNRNKREEGGNLTWQKTSIPSFNTLKSII